MTEPNKKPGKLNLNKEIPKQPETPEESITRFYNTLTNCVIEMAMSLNRAAEIQQEILIELTDMKDNYNRQGKSEGWLTEMDIEEREKEDE